MPFILGTPGNENSGSEALEISIKCPMYQSSFVILARDSELAAAEFCSAHPVHESLVLRKWLACLLAAHSVVGSLDLIRFRIFAVEG